MKVIVSLIIAAASLAAHAQHNCVHEHLVVCPQVEAPRVTELREGKVTVEYNVNDDGVPTDIVVIESSGDQRWENAVTEAVSKWQYLPAAEKRQEFRFIARFADE